MPFMYMLLSCFCHSLPLPTAGWGNSPVTGTGIADDIERVMAVYDKMLKLCSVQEMDATDYIDYINMTKEICTRLDTSNAAYVTKSLSTSYTDKLYSQPRAMNENTQDEYIEKMNKMFKQDMDNRIVGVLYPMIVRDILEKHLPPSQCQTESANMVTWTRDQYDIARRVTATKSYRGCDISMMFTFLEDVCPSVPDPTAGRGNPVPLSAEGIGDDIERIRQSSLTMSTLAVEVKKSTAAAICNRMDTIHINHVRKSVSGTYVQEAKKISTESAKVYPPRIKPNIDLGKSKTNKAESENVGQKTNETAQRETNQKLIGVKDNCAGIVLCFLLKMHSLTPLVSYSVVCYNDVDSFGRGSTNVFIYQYGINVYVLQALTIIYACNLFSDEMFT